MSRLPRSTRATTALAALALAFAALPGCSLLGGANGGQTLYAPQPVVQADPGWPSVGWSLTIAAVDAAPPVDSARIAVRPVPQELQVYKDVSWASRPAEMLERTVLRALEDSGRIPAVAPAGRGIAGDYRLLLDLRRFEADYAGTDVPRATIEVSAKLLHATDGVIVASQTFREARPAAGTALPQVVDAFEQALGDVGGRIAGWTLASGASHDNGASR